MTPQQHGQTPSSDSPRRTSSTRTTAPSESSWAEDGRPTRRVQVAPLTAFPISETAVSQADGEA